MAVGSPALGCRVAFGRDRRGWPYRRRPGCLGYPGAGLLCFACVGIYGCLPAFWPIAIRLLPGPAAAAAIALINPVGNPAGFYNPTIIGALRDQTGSYSAGLFWLAATAVMAIVILLFFSQVTGKACGIRLLRQPEGRLRAGRG